MQICFNSTVLITLVKQHQLFWKLGSIFWETCEESKDKFYYAKVSKKLQQCFTHHVLMSISVICFDEEHAAHMYYSFCFISSS